MKIQLAITSLMIVAILNLVSAVANAADSDLTLVAPGAPPPTILLSAQTEYQLFLRDESARFAARVKAEHPTMKQAEIEKRALAHIASLKYTDDEELAAEELQVIIEKISGVRPNILRAGDNEPLPAGAKILLGPSFARKRGLAAEVDKLSPDGLICQVEGDSLILTGKRARGTLYAAYEFLESLGCRWVMPGEFGEIYPSLKTVATHVNKTSNPDHSQRYFWCTDGQGTGYARWTLRNKGNFVKGPGDQMIAQGHALGGPLRQAASNPKYAIKVLRDVVERKKQPDGTFVSTVVKKEVNGLPDEYYAMVDGKPNYAVPNFSNPKVWDLYAETYIAYFKANPDIDYVSISAEDGFVIDERPESKRLRSNEYDFAMGAYSSTDQLWFFHNRVIERVAKVFPNKKFGVLVYANNMTPPRIEHVNPHMALVIAPLGISPLTAVGDPKERTNVAYQSWLEDWMAQARAAGAETYYYDYEPMGFCWNVAMICPRWGIIGKNYT